MQSIKRNKQQYIFCIFVFVFVFAFVFIKDWGEQDKTCTLVHAVRTLNLMGGEVAERRYNIYNSKHISVLKYPIKLL